MLTNDNLKRRFRWSLCCMFNIHIMVLVLFFSVGLLLMIPITISVAAFRWVLVAGSLRQQYHKPSTVLDGDRCSSGDSLYMVLLFYAIEKHLQCYDNSQSPADPWKLSISANSTGYQNKLDPTNQAIPFDIDVMLFPKVKCHDDIIMMIDDRVKCHDVGWWPIFPGSSSIDISHQVKLMINYHGCVDTLQEECKKWFDKHARDGTNKTARARWIW